MNITPPYTYLSKKDDFAIIRNQISCGRFHTDMVVLFCWGLDDGRPDKRRSNERNHK